MDYPFRQLLQIPPSRLDEINNVLLNSDSKVMNNFIAVVAKYGTPEEINAKHKAARKLDNLMRIVEERAPAHIADLNWLMEQRKSGAFASLAEYRRKVLGAKAENVLR